MTDESNQEAPVSDDSINTVVFMREMADGLEMADAVIEIPLKDMSLLACGGTGEIYSARDDILGRTIAVKLLKKDFKYNTELVERVIREAKAAAQLEHPNIVPIHSLAISPTRGVYFTMKRLRGDSLRHIISQLGKSAPGYTRDFTRSVLLNIFLKICYGVNYAHSKGILHRDLKPENVLVGNYGEVTIIDWGLVKKMPSGRNAPRSAYVIHSTTETSSTKIEFPVTDIELSSENLTLNGEISGTPRFMSPEQIFGNSNEIDTLTDIYSLGIILYELLTYTNPFAKLSDEMEIMNAVSRGQYLLPRQTERRRFIPPELEAICLKAMVVNKENRYQSVSEIIKDIVAYTSDRQVSSYRAPLYRRFRKACSRNPIKTSIVVSICVVLAVVLAWNYFKATLEANEMLQAARQEVHLVSKRIQALNNMIERRHGSEPTPDEQLMEQQRLDEIDTLILAANNIISSIPSPADRSPAVRTLREQMLSERLEFCLKYRNESDLKRVYNSLYIHRHIDDLDYSMKTRVMLEQLRSSMRRGSFLSILSEGTISSGRVTIYQMKFDEETNDLIFGEPLSLAEDALPMIKVSLPPGVYIVEAYQGDNLIQTQLVSLAQGDDSYIVVWQPITPPDGMIYIPGVKRSTPADMALDAIPRMLATSSSSGFFIKKHEVTNGEYLEFWLSLKDSKLRDAYRSRVVLSEESTAFVDAWDDQGQLNTMTVNGNRVFLPDMPVVGIHYEAIEAFCRWKSDTLGRPCRLPTAQEWQLAATGGEAMLYPWGSGFHEDYAFLCENLVAKKRWPLMAPVGEFPKDVSPYGVLGMAGNAREWTATKTADGRAVIKGGSVATSKEMLLMNVQATNVSIPTDVGFRYVVE